MLKYDELFLATTDTIVGIGGSISKENKQKIYDLKKRPLNKSLIIMVGSLAQARTIEGWNHKAEKFARQNWPGAVTLVINKNLAMRMPNCKQLCEFILKIGPIYMTSANISGEPSLSFSDAKQKFSMIKNYFDFCVGTGKASTIIDINTKEILR